MSKSSSKIFTCLSAFFFAAAILTFALHYERYGFRLANCSICTSKDSSSLSLQKVKNDSPQPASIVNRPWLINALPKRQEKLLITEPVCIFSLLSESVANKAPPIFS
jgi:hypothetical protein